MDLRELKLLIDPVEIWRTDYSLRPTFSVRKREPSKKNRATVKAARRQNVKRRSKA